MAKCIELSRTKTQAAEIIDFEKRDLQQRHVGLRIYTYESDMVAATALNSNGKKLHNLEPGFYYVVQATTIRGGKPYGSYKAPKFLNSPDERDAFITRRVQRFWAHRRAANVTS